MTPSEYEQVGRMVEKMYHRVSVGGQDVTATLRQRLGWCEKEGVPTAWLEGFADEWEKVERVLTGAATLDDYYGERYK